MSIDGKKDDKIEKNEKKKSSGKGALVIKAAIALGAVFFAVVLIWYLTIHNYYSKMNIVGGRTEEAENYGNGSIEEEWELIANENSLSEDKLPDEDLPDSTEDEINALGGRGRSDSIILISINKESEQLIATSIMRDIYVEIPGHGNNRINAAYAYGGADLLVETVEKNFKIQIDRYASVDFFVFMDIVDQMGGVDLEISDEEFLVANAYINELNVLLDEPYGTDWLPGGGPHHLNGKQALGYSRIRYVGDADFERTKRQRTVLEQIFNKVKDYNLIELNSLLNIILPEITTDLTEGEAITLALSMNAYRKYDLKQYRLPYDGTWRDMRIKGMSVLGIDFETNIQNLKRDLYAGI